MKHTVAALPFAVLSLVTLVFLSACSGGGQRTIPKGLPECPEMDLREPCGRDAAGNYYRLLR